MSEEETCCTCASILSSKPPAYWSSLDQRTRSRHEKTTRDSEVNPQTPFSTRTEEVQLQTRSSRPVRRLPCCNRSICSKCLESNPRFEAYCPFCQISTAPSSLPQGIKDPPVYTSAPPSPKQAAAVDQNDPTVSDLPPAYSAATSASAAQGPYADNQQDVTHHLRPTDTFASLSLAYNVRPAILRQHNGIFSDHLLSARRTISIPRAYYSGPSLSADPIDSEEETERKSRIRRFMLATKCHEYSVAELYLGQVAGDVDAAVEKWRDDERWERENPFDRKKIGRKKETRSGYGGGLTGQLR